MAGIHHPTRGGTRGGGDQFDWDDVKVDKHRENYLGTLLCTYQCIAPPTPLRANVGNRWGFANIQGYCLTPGADYEGETPPNPVLLYMGIRRICFTVATLTTVR